jgi:hypothetical protein
LGSDKDGALKKYYRLGLGLEAVQQQAASPVEITIKELANRFLAAQQAKSKKRLWWHLKLHTYLISEDTEILF